MSKVTLFCAPKRYILSRDAGGGKPYFVVCAAERFQGRLCSTLSEKCWLLYRILECCGILLSNADTHKTIAFLDVNLADLDADKHADFIIRRVLTCGDLNDMAWLFQ